MSQKTLQDQWFVVSEYKDPNKQDKIVKFETSVVEIEGKEKVLLKIPYHDNVRADFKELIPYENRKWEGDYKAWAVPRDIAKETVAAVVNILNQYLEPIGESNFFDYNAKMTVTTVKTTPPSSRSPSQPQTQPSTAVQKQSTESTAITTAVKLPPLQTGGAGKSYRVRGQWASDSKLVQQYAIKHNINSFVVKQGKTPTEAFCHVRSSWKNRQQEASVTYNFAIEKEAMVFDLIRDAEKYNKPSPIIDFTEEGKPILSVEAQKQLYQRYVNFIRFAERSAESKAMRRAQLKILSYIYNVDFRDDEEVEQESAEEDDVAANS